MNVHVFGLRTPNENMSRYANHSFRGAIAVIV
jgi:hypothetical protein